MIEHEHLTGSFDRGYTGRMSESGVGVLERPRIIPDVPLSEALHQAEVNAQHDPEAGERRPKPWESTFTDHKRSGDWLEEREKKIFRDAEVKTLKIPEHVLRKEKSWAELGWKDDKKREVRERIEQVLQFNELFGLNLNNSEDRKRMDAMVNTTMEVMLASGKKPDEILSELNKRTLDNYRDVVRKDLDRRRTGREEEEPLTKREESTAQMYALTHILGSDNTQDYLTRFVYTDAFRDQLNTKFQREKPTNLYELAWQITYADREHEKAFGVNGEYPVLEMRVDKDKDGNVNGRYVVNQANFIRWMRERVIHWQEQEPDEYVDYFSKVQLKKEYSPVTLGEIINDHPLYFTDETGQYFGDLAKQTLLEPWILLEIRKYHIVYKSVMSSDKKLVEELGNLFAKNKFTKSAAGKNMLHYLSTMALDFGDKHGENTLGGAWNTMFLAYYNFADFENLQGMLGKDASFFTRAGMEKAMEYVLKGRLDETNNFSETMGTLMGSENLANFEKAFTKEDGTKSNTVENSDAFTKFINFLGVMAPNANWKKVIERALINTVAEQYDFHSKEGNTQGIDKHSLALAAFIADAMTLFTGAGAKNDPNAGGFNALSKIALNFQNYRRKMATEARGNAMGNPFTVAQFKMLGLDWMRATRVSEATKVDGIDKDGKQLTRNKTVLEVMEEMRAADRFRIQQHKKLTEKLEEIKAQQGADSEAARAKQREIDELPAKVNAAYSRFAGQLEFKENAMVNYVANHIDRVRQVNEQIMSAKQIDFEKLGKYNPITQKMEFDVPAFQEQFQEKWNKQLRYMIETYGDLNLAMPVRSTVFKRRKDDKDEWVYQTMPLGEAMFGYEMLNIPEFRKCYKDENGKDIPGKYLIEKGRYVIDYTKVDQQKTLLWKQFSLMKIGADLWSHIQAHSRDPKYSIAYFRKVLEAIENIPSEVVGDEFSMRDTFVNNKFFSKDQIKWFKKLSKTTNFRLLLRGLKNDQKSKVDAGGVGDSFSIFINTVFRGY